MVGTKRLDNLEMCVTTVINDGIRVICSKRASREAGRS